MKRLFVDWDISFPGPAAGWDISFPGLVTWDISFPGPVVVGGVGLEVGREDWVTGRKG